MSSRCLCGIVGQLLLVAAAGAYGAVQYEFTLDSARSNANLSLDVQGKTSGTLVGDYDAVTNPAGTRTKPGWFGPFGSTENVAVPVTMDPKVNGTVATPAAGSFLLALDPVAGSVTMTGLTADLSPPIPVALATTATVGLTAFRTKSPDSMYPTGSADVPVSGTTVSQIALAQTPDPAIGTLTVLGPDHYAFTVTPLVVFSAQVTLQGNDMDAATAPLPLSFSGEVTFAGGTAALTGAANLDLTDTSAPNQALPPFPYGLPTVLPAGSTANVILNLTVTQTTTHVTGPLALAATGAPVPEPGALAGLVLAGLAVLGRRRPRR